jgi:hypothetical protein
MEQRAIGSEFFDDTTYLGEVALHVNLSKRALVRLREGAKQFDLSHDTCPPGDFNRPSPPAEIIRSAHSFLTHAGIISRLLFIGKRSGKAHARTLARCARMRDLLEVTACPALENLSMRNDYEHIDERLDELLLRMASGTKRSLEDIRVIPGPSRPGTTTLRHYDYTTDTLTFLGSSYILDSIETEIDFVAERINGAYQKLLEASSKTITR